MQKCFEKVTKQMDDYSSQQNNHKHWEGENLISKFTRLQSLLCSVLYNYNYNTKWKSTQKKQKNKKKEHDQSLRDLWSTIKEPAYTLCELQKEKM